LVGGAVKSSEGIDVGDVVSVTKSSNGEVTEIRIAVERWLGMGEKIVILPHDSYIVLRRTIVVKLPESARGH
jgi:hypothetical protein